MKFNIIGKLGKPCAKFIAPYSFANCVITEKILGVEGIDSVAISEIESRINEYLYPIECRLRSG